METFVALAVGVGNLGRQNGKTRVGKLLGSLLDLAPRGLAVSESSSRLVRAREGVSRLSLARAV